MEEEGQKIIKLNIGNLAVFGLEPPDEIVQDMIRNLPQHRRLHRLEGPVRTAQGGRPLHAAEERQGRDGRRRVPRQRRLRAHHDEHERAAQRRRRGADPRARLSAVDGVGRALRRHAGPLSVRRGLRLDARPRRTWRRRSRRARVRIVVINPNNPTGALYPEARLLQKIVDLARRARPHRLRRRDLRQDAVRRLHAHVDRRRWPTTSSSSPSTACRRTTARAATAPAGWWSRARRRHAADYIEGLGMLASMRLCSNTRRGSWPSRLPSAATRASTTWLRPGGRLAPPARSRAFSC